MKEFAKNTISRICIYFTIAMVAWLIAGLIYVGPAEGIVTSIALLAACVIGGLLQNFWFTDKVLKKPGYPLRIFGFGITFFIVLFAIAWFGGWVPHDNAWAWVSFAVIYLILLAIFTVLFTFIYRKKISLYSDALKRFQEKH